MAISSGAAMRPSGIVLMRERYIPILAPMQAEPEWLTLAEAGDRVRITEVDDEGSVPELRVANLGDLPLLLLDGEQLVGAKQNRIPQIHCAHRPSVRAVLPSVRPLMICALHDQPRASGVPGCLVSPIP